MILVGFLFVCGELKFSEIIKDGMRAIVLCAWENLQFPFSFHFHLELSKSIPPEFSAKWQKDIHLCDCQKRNEMKGERLLPTNNFLNRPTEWRHWVDLT